MQCKAKAQSQAAACPVVAGGMKASGLDACPVPRRGRAPRCPQGQAFSRRKIQFGSIHGANRTTHSRERHVHSCSATDSSPGNCQSLRPRGWGHTWARCCPPHTDHECLVCCRGLGNAACWHCLLTQPGWVPMAKECPREPSAHSPRRSRPVQGRGARGPRKGVPAAWAPAPWTHTASAHLTPKAHASSAPHGLTGTPNSPGPAPAAPCAPTAQPGSLSGH